MGNITDFEAGMKLLRSRMEEKPDHNGNFHVTEEQDAKDAEVMSNPNNWCCVRAIDVEPQYDKEGNVIFPQLSQLSGGEIERNTVHTALNHVVESHDAGNWDACPYVVFAPYNDVVAKNGKPAGLCLVDTYFSTDVDTGLVVPKDSAYVVQPSKEKGGELYTIGEHGATYKTDYFTEEEINKILSMLQPSELEKYNRLMAGDLTDLEKESVLSGDPRVKVWYEKSNNKKQFLSGLMYEDRMVILTHFLRDAVVRLAMAKKGYQYIDDAARRAGSYNYGVSESRVEDAIERIAVNENIDTGAWCHDASFYGKQGIQIVAEGFRGDINDRIVSEKNMDNLFMKMYEWYNKGEPSRDGNTSFFIDAIVNGRFPYDWYTTVYEPRFQLYKKRRLYYYNKVEPQLRERYGHSYLKIQKFKTIEEFDPKFAGALKRQISVLETKFMKWRKQMEHSPKFQKLLQKWKDYVEGNYTDIDEFLKPSIEQQFIQSQQIYGQGGRKY